MHETRRSLVVQKARPRRILKQYIIDMEGKQHLNKAHYQQDKSFGANYKHNRKLMKSISQNARKGIRTFTINEFLTSGGMPWLV